MIEKVKKFPRNLNDILTNPFRDLVKEKLGVLNTPESFMYLFRRFGTPNYSNNDEYKILYDYILKYEDVYISIHASYHEHVYCDLFFPKHYLKDFMKARKELLKRLYIESLKHDVPYSPYQAVFQKPQELTKKQNDHNWNLINTEAHKYFSEEDYAYVDEHWGKKDLPAKVEQMIYDFSRHVHTVFVNSLSKVDKKAFLHYWPTMSDVPEIRKKALKFIQELKKGAYVRDVPINIKGYESEENKISYFI